MINGVSKYDPGSGQVGSDKVGPLETFALRQAKSALGVETEESNDANDIAKFLGNLRAADGDKTAHYDVAYGNRVDFRVSHTMDLAPVYDQAEDGERLIDFRSNQIKRAEHFQNIPASKHLYFVAYNPFRDHWKKEKPQPGLALDIVKHAVLKQSAYGVKVYPPSGYRPAGNEIPDKPWSPFAWDARRQWKARYEATDNDTLNGQLDELLAWCEGQKIPVFAHCGTGEFEARKNYGIWMADPRYWAMALEKHPNLRLCLGHAGGEAYWFKVGDKKLQRWGKTVAELCRHYPNVYCEFGAMADILTPELRKNFVESLKAEMATNGNFPFEDKILYGSDFFMPSSLGGEDYLNSYLTAFTDEDLDDHAAGFFFQNAVNYLDVKRRLDDAHLPASVRKQLENLVP